MFFRFKTDKNKIFYGLGAIKNVGSKQFQILLKKEKKWKVHVYD